MVGDGTLLTSKVEFEVKIEPFPLHLGLDYHQIYTVASVP